MGELAVFASLLEAASPATLTTYRRDGSALTTPVWFRWSEELGFEVVLADGDVKVGHLERDPRCSLLVFETVRPFRGVEVRGTARLEALDDVTPCRVAIAGKYLGPQGGEAFAESRPARRGYVLRVDAERTRTWDLAAALPDAEVQRVPEARLEDRGAGTITATTGWFVLNARDGRWSEKPGQGHAIALTGRDEYEAETFFPMLGMALRVMRRGEVSTTYHWETEQEDFLVLAGEALAILEGEERRLRPWDFVHCPPGTRHAFVGASDEPCVILCASSRQFQKDGPWGYYSTGEAAARHNAASPEETQDGSIAYARFPPPRETRYPGGLLPGDA